MASTGPESPIRTDEINDFFTYIASIDWTEKWLIALVMFHFTCFFLIIVTRKSGLLQAIIFITLLLSVYFAENLNEMAAKHWQVFTKEQYFDSDGLFFSTVYSTPVLFNCLLLLFIWMSNLGAAVSEMRQMKMNARKKAEERKEKKEN
ncbi:transmembrane protein 18-like [Crassostrea angulata]|uniref:transmembrane protein 18-like n=1 Tax=Magallana angulata TaxID=2784310 RepID=UPI0022B17E69|nr:transmembrane protein 18-like [Crassostrea angulata]